MSTSSGSWLPSTARREGNARFATSCETTTPTTDTPQAPKLKATVTRKEIKVSKGLPVAVTLDGAAKVRVALTYKKKGKATTLASWG